ncbi:NERD domain-containing protein [Brevundimonas sp. R86498]|uniref:NERD domain-containing protein n=1 Tax=Brevundimonas sp. R86498 TaxID=3093845 RepID=UPI0037C6DF17
MGIKTTPRVEVYFGGPPTDRTENKFLARLEADLYRLGQDAVIFANFLVGPKSQQIDALVATETGALLVEIKGYGSPVRGALNGAWSQRMPDGTRRSLGSRNPYHQASDGRFAVADLIKTQLKRDGLPALDGLVCLYPSPPSGTDLPTGDFKAWIGGYDRALELLEKRRIHPLALDDWRTLARSLNLEPREQTYASAERVVIDDYCRRYGELAGVLTGPYAPVELRLDDCLLNLSTVGDLLRDGSHLQIVGPSGCGKSALLSRLGQDANTGRFAPIPVSARMFTGDLGSLMKRGLASATGKHLSEFLRAADVTGVVIVLLIDGFNECPTNFQNDLLKALLAARLRYGVQIVLTSQHPVDTPVDLDEVVLELPQPSPDHTRAIVEARLDRPLSLDELPALEIVRTANDAAVLAEVIRTPHAADGRHALYSAFARRRIGDAGESHGVGRGLRNLATHMRQEFHQHPASGGRLTSHRSNLAVVERPRRDLKAHPRFRPLGGGRRSHSLSARPLR